MYLTQRYIFRWNISKFVKYTILHIVFSTLFSDETLCRMLNIIFTRSSLKQTDTLGELTKSANERKWLPTERVRAESSNRLLLRRSQLLLVRVKSIKRALIIDCTDTMSKMMLSWGNFYECTCRWSCKGFLKTLWWNLKIHIFKNLF